MNTPEIKIVGFGYHIHNSEFPYIMIGLQNEHPKTEKLKKGLEFMIDIITEGLNN